MNITQTPQVLELKHQSNELLNKINKLQSQYFWINNTPLYKYVITYAHPEHESESELHRHDEHIMRILVNDLSIPYEDYIKLYGYFIHPRVYYNNEHRRYDHIYSRINVCNRAYVDMLTNNSNRIENMRKLDLAENPKLSSNERNIFNLYMETLRQKYNQKYG